MRKYKRSQGNSSVLRSVDFHENLMFCWTSVTKCDFASKLCSEYMSEAHLEMLGICAKKLSHPARLPKAYKRECDLSLTSLSGAPHLRSMNLRCLR